MSYLGSKKHKLAVVKGGKTRAQQLLQLKERNIDIYNSCPSKCSHCEQSIEYTRRKNKFCSSSCAAKSNNTGRVVSETQKQKVAELLRKPTESRFCPTCNTEFQCKISSKKIYCESKCYSITPEGRYNSSLGGKVGGKISASIQIRRSKNEILFADKCRIEFGHILENVPMFEGWDADVIIPSKKIAVLWNGNWHRKKLREGHSVKQVQNRDRIKLKKIRDNGYLPYVIEDYGRYNPVFVEQQFHKFLTIFVIKT
jgi:hypothetical protein